MKLLIFSDTHLTDKFDEKKFRFLHKIISAADKVIINGDFWEGYFTTFDTFISSGWNRLFPLLKERDTVYIFGNHDPERMNDNRVNLFCNHTADEYEIKVGDFTYKIEHGNRLDIALNRFDKKYFHFHDRNTIRFKLLQGVDSLFETASRVFGQPVITPLSHKSNKEIKPMLKGKLQKNVYHVFGHTHYGEVDLEYNFINTGIVLHGLGQYVLIDEKGFEFMEEWYRK